MTSGNICTFIFLYSFAASFASGCRSLRHRTVGRLLTLLVAFGQARLSASYRIRRDVGPVTVSSTDARGSR